MASTTREEMLQRKRERAKEYYHRNRHSILTKQKQANSVKYICECGAKVGLSRREIHETTDKHHRYCVSKYLRELLEKMEEESFAASNNLRAAAASALGTVRKLVSPGQ